MFFKKKAAAGPDVNVLTREFADDIRNKAQESALEAVAAAERVARAALASVTHNRIAYFVRAAIVSLVVNFAFVGFALSLGIGGGMYVANQIKIEEAQARVVRAAAEHRRQQDEHYSIIHSGDQHFGRPERKLPLLSQVLHLDLHAFKAAPASWKVILHKKHH